MVKRIIFILLSFISFKALSQAGFKTSSFSDTLTSLDLVFFNVIPVEDHVVISWATNSEYNSAYFTIEKSKDAHKFIKVIDVPGNGKSNSYKEYVETDYLPFKETSYYRIKETNFNGSTKYFPMAGVAFNTKKNNSIYPTQSQLTQNPTTDPLPLKNPEILVVLQDAEGRDYTTKIEITQENAELFGVDVFKVVPPEFIQ